jgi:hypothetical protein
MPTHPSQLLRRQWLTFQMVKVPFTNNPHLWAESSPIFAIDGVLKQDFDVSLWKYRLPCETAHPG